MTDILINLNVSNVFQMQQIKLLHKKHWLHEVNYQVGFMTLSLKLPKLDYQDKTKRENALTFIDM
jgi:hypothetical protein